MTINSSDLLSILVDLGFDFFTGVPDSTLGHFCNQLETEHRNGTLQHIVAANEGNAVAIAAGYFLSTGKIPVVYMQNSGLGNAVNPLTSIVHNYIYSIPILVIVGHRGAPAGIEDEIQHKQMGKITIPLIELMGFENIELDSKSANVQAMLESAKTSIMQKHQPVFITVKQGEISRDKIGKVAEVQSSRELTYEPVIKHLLGNLKESDVVISSTGFISRFTENLIGSTYSSPKHLINFGGMGHVSSIALGYGISRCNTAEKVLIIDGDGSALMHLGGLAKLLQHNSLLPNVAYVILNNNCHYSVGGQETATPLFSFADFFHLTTSRVSERAIKKYKIRDFISLAELNSDHLFSEDISLTEILLGNSEVATPPRPKRDASMFRSQFNS